MVRRILLALVIAALVTVSGLSLGRVYDGPLLLELVGGAALLAVVISSLLRRVSPAVVAPVSVLAMIGYALACVLIAARAGGVDGSLAQLSLDAARNAVPRLLTALIPVEAEPDTVLGPVVLAWLAGFASAELAARAHRPALALIPPAALYAGALVLVGPNAPVVAWHPVVFAALAAVGLAVGSARRGAGPTLVAAVGAAADSSAGPSATASAPAPARPRLSGGLAVGVVAVLAAIIVVAPLIGARVGAAPGDPRGLVQPPSLDVLDQNPLSRLGGWASNPDQVLFTIDVVSGAGVPTPTASSSGARPATSASAHDTRLRLAVLPDWDGVTWHMDGDYRTAGRVLPAVPTPPGQVTHSANLAPPLTTTEQVTIADLGGRLLPAISAPQRVDGLRVAYDQQTGTLLNTTVLTSGLSYTVTSVTPTIDLNLLQAATVPSGPDVARYLEVGESVPDTLATFARNIVTGAGSPYTRATTLETFLATHYRFAADAPTGHSYPNLGFFLLGDDYAGGRQGTSEQFATAFATLGRLLGLPTRVVVGFTTPAGGGPVTAGDAVAWPEVLFSGIGWVAFNPLPASDADPRPIQDSLIPKATPSTSPPPPQSYEAPPTSDAVSPGPSNLAVGGGPSTTSLAGGIGGAAVLLVVAFIAVIVVWRALRTRSRLRPGDPPRQVLGAWDEVLDALVLTGAPAPAHLAAHEVAQHAAAIAVPAPRRAAPPSLDELATRVNAASFAGPTGDGPDAMAAHSATMQALAFVRALYRGRPWWRRLLWRVDPRPLRRRQP